MLTCLVPVLFTFYIQGVLKLKNDSGSKGLKYRKVLLNGIPMSYTFLYLKQNVLYWPDDDRLRSKHVATV